MTNNMEIWNKVKQPPAEALKTIIGGRLKGMTDISPQWRFKIMTEVFGLCGEGWKYTIDNFWTQPGCNEQVMVFAQVSLFIKTNDTWGAPIPGVGGSTLTVKEKNGLYTSDEAYKMATTDALSVAFKTIGVAADIYLGRWDGKEYSKNKEDVIAMPEKKFNELKNLIEAQQTDEATKAEFQKVLGICKELNDMDSYNNLKEIALNHRKFLKKVSDNEQSGK